MTDTEYGNGVNGKTENITVEGHIGTWYIIAGDQDDDLGCDAYGRMFLLEHEEFGDEAACIIVDGKGQIILEDVWNGFEDYWEQKSLQEGGEKKLMWHKYLWYLIEWAVTHRDEKFEGCSPCGYNEYWESGDDNK